MVRQLLAQLRRHPHTPPPSRGPAIQRAEWLAARRRILTLAAQQRAAHDKPTR